jgi:hypothetical protein
MTTTADGRQGHDQVDDVALDAFGTGRDGDQPAEPPVAAATRPPWRRLVAWSLWRRVIGWVVTVLACALVGFALIAPNDFNRVTPVWFLRLPVEGIVGAAILLVLPAKARRVVAVIIGVLLGVLAILKVVDIGFFAVLFRPFDLVLDWAFIQFAVEFVEVTSGEGTAIVAVVAALLLITGLLVLMPLAVLRLSRIAARHRTGSLRTLGALAVVWVACAVAGVQFVPQQPVASRSAALLAYEHGRQIPVGLRDRHDFMAQASIDVYKNTPGEALLTALRGKDVVLVFIESYGRDAIEDPEFAPQVGPVLADGDRRLNAAGLSARSGWLTSPTVGGGSWLAHATLLSGLWVDNQLRYRSLVTSDRLTLNGAFGRADWRTVGVMPGVTRAWPEGSFYRYDRVIAAQDFGYRGPRFGYATMPDQYTLSAFQRMERPPGHAPVMAEIALLSSHVPWKPLPDVVDWDDLGDGSLYNAVPAGGEETDANVWGDPATARADYRDAIEYSLRSLISYAETYGDEDLVLVFLGDHQPSPLITGEGATRDVPITIVARDPAVLDQIAGWGWESGIKPGPKAPVWPMNEFRDRFLAAFGSQPGH